MPMVNLTKAEVEAALECLDTILDMPSSNPDYTLEAGLDNACSAAKKLRAARRQRRAR